MILSELCRTFTRKSLTSLLACSIGLCSLNNLYSQEIYDKKSGFEKNILDTTVNPVSINKNPVTYYTCSDYDLYYLPDNSEHASSNIFITEEIDTLIKGIKIPFEKGYVKIRKGKGLFGLRFSGKIEEDISFQVVLNDIRKAQAELSISTPF